MTPPEIPTTKTAGSLLAHQKIPKKSHEISKQPTGLNGNTYPKELPYQVPYHSQPGLSQ